MMTIGTHRTIEYTPLSTVPGLSFRHFAGESDYQIVLDLWLRNREFNGYDWVFTLEDIKQIENQTKNYNVYSQLILVELQKLPIGYLMYHWSKENSSENLILHINIDLSEEYWDGEIANLMLRYAEERLSNIVKELLVKDSPKYQISWGQTADKQIKFYQANGYIPARYFVEMVRPTNLTLSDHPLPLGLEIRPVKREDYRKIWDACHEAFIGEWGYEIPTEEQYQAWPKARNFQPELWKVAWDGNAVAGMVLNYLDDEENKKFNIKRGYTESISVGRKWRGRGLAKALIAESIRMFKTMGMEETALGVDVENPTGALKLYTRMGYHEVDGKTSIILRKDL